MMLKLQFLSSAALYYYGHLSQTCTFKENERFLRSEEEYWGFFYSLIVETKETKDSEAGNNSSCSVLKCNKQMDTVKKIYFLSS